MSDELFVGYFLIIRRKRFWVGSRGVKELELGKRGIGVLWIVILIWLYIYVWFGIIVFYWLFLIYCYLVLYGYVLGWRYRMVVIFYGVMVIWRYIYGVVCYVELIGFRFLYWYMVRFFKEKWLEWIELRRCMV